MSAAPHTLTPQEPIVQKLPGGERALQIWPLSTDESLLQDLLTYIFEKYWDQIVFGPLIEGAAYELTCPCAPTKVRLFDGYLTVSFGGPHFHLCIGENKGAPRDRTPEDLKARRRPSKAQIFRRLDKGRGAAVLGIRDGERRRGADDHDLLRQPIPAGRRPAHRDTAVGAPGDVAGHRAALPRTAPRSLRRERQGLAGQPRLTATAAVRASAPGRASRSPGRAAGQQSP